MNPKIKEKLMKDFGGKGGIDLSLIIGKDSPDLEGAMGGVPGIGGLGGMEEKGVEQLMKRIVDIGPMLTPEETIQAIHMLSMGKDAKYNEAMGAMGGLPMDSGLPGLPPKPELEIDNMLAGGALPPAL